MAQDRFHTILRVHMSCVDESREPQYLFYMLADFLFGRSMYQFNTDLQHGLKIPFIELNIVCHILE